MAQELKKPTLEDVIPGGETYHKPENKSYQWWGDAACLELGIDNIEGTWAVKGLSLIHIWPARYPLHIQTSSPGGRSLQKSPYAAGWTLP